MENQGSSEVQNCVIKLRVNPQRRRNKIYIGCGAGFGGDRPMAALKLLQRVKELNYLVLECLAERTLADRYQAMMSSGDGFDPRMDTLGAQEKVLDIASGLGINITVAVAHEVAVTEPGAGSSSSKSFIMQGGISTYLGAAPIVECLEKYKPNVVITSRVADAALFLGPMVYELGWNWDNLELLAQGSLAGHLLECGCQLTGGYFMHPGDKYRDISFHELLDLSLPYAEVSVDGKVIVAKADGSGGVLNCSTCAEQLLYEVGDPSAYVTPDVAIDIQDVSFQSLSRTKVLCSGAKPSVGLVPEKLLRLIPEDCGWKGWGEISYGGHECVIRARAAEFLVRSWLEEVIPGLGNCILSYTIGLDSLKTTSADKSASFSRASEDIRLRMDGLFEKKEYAIQFTKEFTALYTNGPAGGGGISTGHKKEIMLKKELVGRERVFWRIGVKHSGMMVAKNQGSSLKEDLMRTYSLHKSVMLPARQENTHDSSTDIVSPVTDLFPAPSSHMIPLHEVAHSRAGDKGNDLNFSLIPHFPPDIKRLKTVITLEWVKGVVSALLSTSSFQDSTSINKRDKWVDEHVKVEIYEVKGIQSLNVVVRNILDGGVNCSRRLDRHGKTISDLILCQQVVLPP